ncbi:MAG: hypothetical protein E5Y19_24205 [Mesorhizobium sp.]|nr:MAG: hypothetical protein E5Y19_24205 [Mesorhizobium sp.]
MALPFKGEWHQRLSGDRDAEGRLNRLYQAIESGIADANDPTLKDRVAAVKAERDSIHAAVHASDERVQQEGREFASSGVSAFRALITMRVFTRRFASRPL